MLSTVYPLRAMDVLTDVLNALHLQSTLYCRAELTAPWMLRFAPTHIATFHVVEQTSCWLQVDGEPTAVALADGDVIMLPHGTGHQIGHAPNTTVVATIQLDQEIPTVCQVRHFEGDGAHTTLLCGLFNFDQDNGHPLLQQLPPLIHIGRAAGQTSERLDATLKFLASEAGSSRPGTETMIKRLADILFVQIIRFWVEYQAKASSGWLSALRDPQISAALALIHRCPERAWTVQGLAQEVALSRAAFAARFSNLVGEPPLHYLTGWRLRTAAGLLRRRELGMAEIAERVGYQSEVAFSKAFKRELGVAPGTYRRRCQAVSTRARGLP